MKNLRLMGRKFGARVVKFDLVGSYRKRENVENRRRGCYDFTPPLSEFAPENPHSCSRESFIIYTKPQDL